jgi:hypothetical protein
MKHTSFTFPYVTAKLRTSPTWIRFLLLSLQCWRQSNELLSLLSWPSIKIFILLGNRSLLTVPWSKHTVLFLATVADGNLQLTTTKYIACLAAMLFVDRCVTFDWFVVCLLFCWLFRWFLVLSYCFYLLNTFVCKLDVHGSVHRNINLIERTNKMQPCSRIYYSNVS